MGRSRVEGGSVLGLAPVRRRESAAVGAIGPSSPMEARMVSVEASGGLGRAAVGLLPSLLASSAKSHAIGGLEMRVARTSTS